jgi:hypothetical protein
MANAHDEKADAKKQQLEAKYNEFKAKIKEAGADGKLFIKDKLHDLSSLID